MTNDRQSLFARLTTSLLVSALAGLCVSAWAEEVSLGTNVPDFEHFHNRGSGSIEHVRCIFNHMGYTPVVNRMPWRRARREVATGRINGFFTAVESIEVDKYATLSAPLLLENWYWYWPAHRSAPESWRDGVRLGAILGSHQAIWLDQKGFPVHLRVNSLPQLIKLMISGRIDAFIADRDHVDAALERLDIEPERYQQRFLRYAPLGVYFGNEFLGKHPGFLERFNRRIFSCAGAGFVMSGAEQAVIHELLQEQLDNWAVKEQLPSVLATYNRQVLSEADRAERDRLWRAAFLAGNEDAVQGLIDPHVSDQLRILEVDAGGLFTELILTDAQGRNVAVSDMTSDYWQGDESKFTSALGLTPGQLHFGPIHYDESTRMFQVQVSCPVFDPGSGAFMGVLIVGVNVERALSSAG